MINFWKNKNTTKIKWTQTICFSKFNLIFIEYETELGRKNLGLFAEDIVHIVQYIIRNHLLFSCQI